MSPLWDVRWLGDDTYGRGQTPGRDEYDDVRHSSALIEADTAEWAARFAVADWHAIDSEDYTHEHQRTAA